MTKRNPAAQNPLLQIVDAFIDALDHPFKHEIIALRQSILTADARIEEGIKWNAPSFRTTEYFATFHLRAKEGVQIILHLGAKKRANEKCVTIADPQALLTWLGPDRASVTFRDLDEIEAKRSAFTEIVRAWIEFV